MSLPILNCDNCGACCLQQESPPGFLSILVYGEQGANCEADIERFNAMPPESLAELHEYAKHMRDDGIHPNNSICLWLDETTMKCRHYDIRPEVCRTQVILGDESCQYWRNTLLHTERPES